MACIAPGLWKNQGAYTHIFLLKEKNDSQGGSQVGSQAEAFQPGHLTWRALVSLRHCPLLTSWWTTEYHQRTHGSGLRSWQSVDQLQWHTPWTEPCGTPVVIGNENEVDSPSRTEKDCPVRYEAITNSEVAFLSHPLENFLMSLESSQSTSSRL